MKVELSFLAQNWKMDVVHYLTAQIAPMRQTDHQILPVQSFTMEEKDLMQTKESQTTYSQPGMKSQISIQTK